MRNDFFEQVLTGVKRVCITGHVKPDGDCVGSCLGLKNYLADNFPQVQADVYLDPYDPSFSFMRYENQVKHSDSSIQFYDLFISLDCADLERIGLGKKYFQTADRTLCIDHHVSNPGYAGQNYILPDASACAEILYQLFDQEKIGKETAECLYTGIAHDTGIFKYSNVTGDPMRAAADLIDRGISFDRILTDTIFTKTYVQQQMLAEALQASVLLLDGRCIYSYIRLKTMEQRGATIQDTHGIVEKLRDTKGVDCAIFAYEVAPGQFKVSTRSKQIVDVNVLCNQFGGGGHVRAAGCSMTGTCHDVINGILPFVEKQLQENKG